MRRCYLAFIVMFLLITSSLIARDSTNDNVTYTEIVQMDANAPSLSTLHPTAKDLVIVWMTYSPAYKEAHIYYRCPRQLFDMGEALNTTKVLLVGFVRERGLRNYRNFPADEIYKEESKRDKDGVQWCRYERHIQFYD